MTTAVQVPAHPGDADVSRSLPAERVIWLTAAEALGRLTEGEAGIGGQFVHGSNDTFLAGLDGAEAGP